MYVILGATGNTGGAIAASLLKAGKAVTAVGRDAAKLENLKNQGATIAIGDITDSAFLTKTFAGATAVYTLVPPNYGVTDWRAYTIKVATATTLALAAAKVPNVVNLSSIGAHLPEGAGPVSGLYYMEQMLNNIPNLNVLHLRAAYFMQNFYGSLGMFKHMHINGTPAGADAVSPIVHVRDIAAVAAERLLSLGYTGSNVEFVAGAEDLNFAEMTAIVGKGIGKPELAYVQFSREDNLNGMLGAGLPPEIAKGFAAMFDVIADGRMMDGYARTEANTTPTSLAWFAENELKYAYEAA
jgi:uncharacterized protein YbjT (DUF2867 family)